MINAEKWKPFLLSDLFYIKKGKRLTKEDQSMGDTLFIGATATNNGITSHIGQAPIHEGNTISLTYNGSIGEAFYQSEPFWASDDVNVLYPKGFELNEKVALFFCTILRHEKQMWSYARKWNLKHMNATIIKLPVNVLGQPDFEFMEKFMDSLDGDVADIPDYFLNEGYEKACWFLDNVNQEEFETKYVSAISPQKRDLSERKWKGFKLIDIFYDIHNGKSYNSSDLINVSDQDDYIAYITRTENNNGISMCVPALDYDGLEEANAITIGDTTATAFYQDRAFITGPHIVVLRADWLNIYTATFVIALLNREKFRYPVFGRAFTKSLIRDTEISLPLNKEGNPDFKFMEEYIKSQPFSVNSKGAS